MKKPCRFCGAICSFLKVTLSCKTDNFIRIVAGWSKNHNQTLIPWIKAWFFASKFAPLPQILEQRDSLPLSPLKNGARDDLQGITSHHRLQGMDMAVLHVSCSEDKAFSPAAGVHDVHGRSHLGKSTRARKTRSFSKLNSFGRRWGELWKWQCYINGRIHLESILFFKYTLEN